MTQLELLEAANAGYPDAYLAVYYDEKTGESREGSGDTLAEFIVSELTETFNRRESAQDQIAEAVRVMEVARDNISGVIRALQQRGKRS